MSSLIVKVGATNTQLGDRAFYTLVEDFRYMTEKHCITVRAGFPTDFASVPRIPLVFSVFGSLWESHAPAVIHDALCRYQLLPRKEVDKIFYEQLKAEGLSRWRAWTMYAAVRMFGGYSDEILDDGLAHLVECELI